MDTTKKEARYGSQLRQATPAERSEHQWRRLSLDVTYPDGRAVGMELLRPVAWLVEHGLQEGMSVRLPDSELGEGATATLRQIDRCPAIAGGDGQVVTGRFVTAAGVEVLDLIVDDTLGRRSKLRGTPGHPVWSEWVGDWVPLMGLRPGERVRLPDGSGTVVLVEVIEGRQPVWNLEVHGTHTYYAGNAGVLVHNVGDCNVPRRLITSDKQLGKKIAQRARELGLNPAGPRVRAMFKDRIRRIFENADEVRSGVFRGQGPNGTIGGDIRFFRRGKDVVLTDSSGNFITLLIDGASNSFFVNGVPLP